MLYADEQPKAELHPTKVEEDARPTKPKTEHKGWAQYGDSAIFQGMHVKVDIANPMLVALKTRGAVQQYEVSVNVNLLKRFYPTLEAGYGWGTDGAAGGMYHGYGGFTRIGMDLNPLKKGRNNDYALLVGVRLGVGLQNYELTGVTTNDSYWGSATHDVPASFRADCWGEIVAGAQVKVAGPFFMGWYVRIHSLFTGNRGTHQPYYIPGYGWKDGSIFGMNYYVGLRF